MHLNVPFCATQSNQTVKKLSNFYAKMILNFYRKLFKQLEKINYYKKSIFKCTVINVEFYVGFFYV